MVTRYNRSEEPCWDSKSNVLRRDGMVAAENGAWVSFSDYEALLAQTRQLIAIVGKVRVHATEIVSIASDL